MTFQFYWVCHGVMVKRQQECTSPTAIVSSRRASVFNNIHYETISKHPLFSVILIVGCHLE